MTEIRQRPFDQEQLGEFVPEDIPVSETPAKKSLRRKIAAYTGSAAFFGTVIGGGFAGYEIPNGMVHSNHEYHAAKIARYEDCAKVVQSRDTDHNGIATAEFNDSGSRELTACGFNGLWDYVANKLDKRRGMLDSWVKILDINGEVVLPSESALASAISTQRQESNEYAVEARTAGTMIGGAAGFVGFFAAFMAKNLMKSGWEKERERQDEAEAERYSADFAFPEPIPPSE